MNELTRPDYYYAFLNEKKNKLNQKIKRKKTEN